jgi:hypothetical protein
VMGMTLCLVAVYHLLCLLFSSWKSENDKTGDDQRLMLVSGHTGTGSLLVYLKYYQLDPLHQSDADPCRSHSRSDQSIASFGSLLVNLMRSLCVLTALSLLLTLPVYVLKHLDVKSVSEGGDTQYITHTHMYNWLWTMAFVSGTTPAIILLVAGFVCLSYFNLMMNRLGGSGERSLSVMPTPSPPMKSVTGDQDHFMRVTSVWLVFSLNIVIVGTVNGLYIWSTLLDFASEVRLWIQLSFALFSSLWIVVVRFGLPSQIKESRDGVWLFICLNVMNSVMIPCVVTALSTPSCYQVSVLIFWSSWPC